jgi:hypothetical protein
MPRPHIPEAATALAEEVLLYQQTDLQTQHISETPFLRSQFIIMVFDNLFKTWQSASTLE